MIIFLFINIKMALTNAERQKRYRERQLLNNKEAYDKKIKLDEKDIDLLEIFENKPLE
jgi:hypothetical protein